MTPEWLDTVKFDDRGLVPAVVQGEDGEVLMVAYMNREALLETLERRRGVFWSRSRGKMWRKGEESGHHQEVLSIALDCDRDCVLIRVKQIGGAACHTGRKSCFFHHVTPANVLEIRGDVLFDPAKVYRR